jgi:hypothetical protein
MDKTYKGSKDKFNQGTGFMPDSQDKTNIQNLINTFNKLDVFCEIHERKHKNPNDCYVKHARWEAYESGLIDQTDDYNLKNKEMDMRHIATMHPAFAEELEKAYPGIFRYKEHTIWFVKNFPQFQVSRKI